MIDHVGTAAWLERIYTEHRHQIFTYLLGKSRGDWHLAEDLTSQTFVRAYTAKYIEGNEPAWLQRIAQNLFLDHVKSAYYKRQSLYELHLELTVDTSDPELDPECIVTDLVTGTAASAAYHKQLADVVREIDALRNTRQQQILRLALKGLSAESIRDELDINVTTYKMARYRAINAIRSNLAVVA